MNKIYKYNLPVNGNVITINDGIIEILDLQLQDGVPVMWAMVNPEAKVVEPIEIIAIGTGWTIPIGVDEYLGTVQDEYGFVWHYFTVKLEELKQPEEQSYM